MLGQAIVKVEVSDAHITLTTSSGDKHYFFGWLDPDMVSRK
jgi:hypothetical protein